jgi:hypothetical protein
LAEGIKAILNVGDGFAKSQGWLAPTEAVLRKVLGEWASGKPLSTANI